MAEIARIATLVPGDLSLALAAPSAPIADSKLAPNLVKCAGNLVKCRPNLALRRSRSGGEA